MNERAPYDDVVANALRRAVGDPTGDLPDVLARGTRARRSRARRKLALSGVALGVAASCAAAAFVMVRSDPSRPQPVHRAPGIEGIYEERVRDTKDPQLNGTWRLAFRPDDTVIVTAPSGYTGVTTGVSYRVSGDVLRIDLGVQDLCSGDAVGTYRWTRTAAGLALSPVSDQCPARTRLFSGGEWLPAD